MKRICALVLCLSMLLSCMGLAIAEESTSASHGFTQVETRWVASENATGTLYRHEPSGLSLFHLENDAEERAFSIGFITPPHNDAGANHVLEHAVLCGNEKYPLPNLMHHLRNTSLARTINATTNDQSTAYIMQTSNLADYYNLMDVTLHAVFEPLLLWEENIFLQQGVRWEASAEGFAPNGVVYNELRLNSLESGTSMLLAATRALHGALFEEDTPIFSSGGETDALLDLTWQEVVDTHAAYYHPDNALVFVSGWQELARTFALLEGILQALPAGDGPVAPVYRLRSDALPVLMPDADASALVDIGFAFSGIPVHAPRNAYARDAMLLMAIEHLRMQWPEVYMVLDETSGYATFSVIVSGVPAAEVDGVTGDMTQYLREELPTLLDSEAMQEALAQYEWMVEDGYGWSVSATLKGFANGGDPYALLDKEGDFAFLREHPAHLEVVWREHIADTPHQAVAVMAHQPREATEARDFTAEEEAQLRQQTERFEAWVDTPETEEQLASLPLLRIEDYAPADLDHSYEAGTREGIRFWLQPGEYTEGLLSFAVPMLEERWLDLSLLSRLITAQGKATAYFFPDGDPEQADHVLPKFIMHPADMENEPAQAIQGLADALLQPLWITAETVQGFLAMEQQDIARYLGNAYSRTLEAMYSDLSPLDRFRGQTLGLIGQGTEAYLTYLKEMAEEPPEAVAEMLQTLAGSIADREGLMVYLRGEQEALDQLLTAIVEAFPCTRSERQCSVLPATGAHSSLVITPQAEVTVHYLQAGVFWDTAWTRSGQMDIMARVVQNSYLLPELRNKRGAYGAQCIVSDGFLTLGASGVRSMDETYAVLQGAGDYLRTLEMSEAYLEAMIVAAVHDFDWDHGADAYYAMEADLSGRNTDWLASHRAEMLATTVEDVKAFADFLDEMVAQQRIFAYTNAQGAETSLPFAQTVEMAQ